MKVEPTYTRRYLQREDLYSHGVVVIVHLWALRMYERPNIPVLKCLDVYDTMSLHSGLVQYQNHS